VALLALSPACATQKPQLPAPLTSPNDPGTNAAQATAAPQPDTSATKSKRPKWDIGAPYVMDSMHTDRGPCPPFNHDVPLNTSHQGSNLTVTVSNGSMMEL
jgi:hypothetical protein